MNPSSLVMKNTSDRMSSTNLVHIWRVVFVESESFLDFVDSELFSSDTVLMAWSPVVCGWWSVSTNGSGVSFSLCEVEL